MKAISWLVMSHQESYVMTHRLLSTVDKCKLVLFLYFVLLLFQPQFFLDKSMHYSVFETQGKTRLSLQAFAHESKLAKQDAMSLHVTKCDYSALHTRRWTLFLLQAPQRTQKWLIPVVFAWNLPKFGTKTWLRRQPMLVTTITTRSKWTIHDFEWAVHVHEEWTTLLYTRSLSYQ